MNPQQLLSPTEINDIFSTSSVAMAIYTGDQFHIAAATDAMLSFWGKDRSVIGRPLVQALPELNMTPFLNQLQGVLRSGEPIIGKSQPAEYQSESGLRIRFYDYEYRPLRNDQHEIYGVVNVATDVTEKVLGMQESARLADAAIYKLEAMVMNTPIAMAILTGEDLIVDIANQPMLDIWRREREQVVGRGLVDIFPELVSQPNPDRMRGVMRTGQRFTLPETEVILGTLEGELKSHYARFSYDPIFETDGTVKSILLTIINITEEVLNRRALQKTSDELAAINEEQTLINEELQSTNEELQETQQLLEQTIGGLAENEGRFRNLVGDASVGIIVLTGSDMEVSIVNQAYSRIVDRTVEELKGQPLFSVIPGAEAYFRPIIARVLETGQPEYLYNQPYLVYHKSTEIAGYLDVVYQPYRESGGAITGVMILCQEVSAQVAARQLLEANEQRLRFLLNAMPQQVWTATPDGALNYVNEVVSHDFGQSSDQVVGQGWQAFVHPDDLPGALEKWRHSLQTSQQYLTEFRLKFADGGYCWHLARALPLIENGKVTYWIGTNTNIHQQKVNDAKKDEFISIASHELKTPLTTIKAFFQLIARQSGGAAPVNGFIAKAERQVDRLGRLIEDLLDVSKINAGKMAYNQESFNFGKMLSETVENVQQTNPSHQIELRVDCDVSLKGDQHRLEQVIINLLNNAIKYAPNSRKVIVHCELEGQNLIVSVQDFGIGIPEQHLKGLFDRFYRVDNSSSRFQGLGLGLFISNEIVKRHGGSFWIESKTGEGSTFYFLLPLNGKQVFSDIAGDDKTFYEGSYIDIRYQEDDHYLNVDWKGYQNYESVVKGCGILMDLMQKNNCHLVLNDNTWVRGNWSEAADWGAETWFPAMGAAGLKKFAWVYSPSTFSRISASKSLPPDSDAIQFAFFDDRATAFAWLMKSAN